MSATHKQNDKTQIAIILTDGHSNVDKSRTIPEAKLAHKDGIDIIVIGDIIYYAILRYNVILLNIHDSIV